MPDFFPGAQLSALYYSEVVAPLLGDLRHSAALIGFGSDVLGFDSRRSTDHGWGPRCVVFVDESVDARAVASAVDAGLPESFRGWPTRFGWDAVPVQHHVAVEHVTPWMRSRLGIDPEGGISEVDWLLLPQQRVLEIVDGPVHHDGLGRLGAIRTALAWYPDSVWLWMLGAQWERIVQEEAFVGRASEAGDELGSALVAARLVRELMKLCLLIERRYSPYSKWLGTAFSQVEIGRVLAGPMRDACAATTYDARERCLSEVYVAVAERFNALGLTASVDAVVGPYHSRPFQVLGASRFAVACAEAQTNEVLRSLPLVGSVDQFVDSTELLTDPVLAQRLRLLFEGA